MPTSNKPSGWWESIWGPRVRATKKRATLLPTLRRRSTALIKASRQGNKAWLTPGVQEKYQFLTGKPLLYVANVGEDELQGNPLAQELVDYGKKDGSEVVILSAKIEAEITQLPETERKDFNGSLGLQESGYWIAGAREPEEGASDDVFHLRSRRVAGLGN